MYHFAMTRGKATSNTVSTFNIIEGVHQGSTLSLCFIMLLDNLLTRIRKQAPKCRCMLFTDDISQIGKSHANLSTHLEGSPAGCGRKRPEDYQGKKLKCGISVREWKAGGAVLLGGQPFNKVEDFKYCIWDESASVGQNGGGTVRFFAINGCSHKEERKIL